MNSDITEQYLNTSYDNFSREQQKLLNDLKTETDDKKTKNLHKQINIIHSIQLNMLKLKSIKNINYL